MSANSRHRADSAACDREAAYDVWCERLDYALIDHRINPAAFTRAERLAAFTEEIEPTDAAESFACNHYHGHDGYVDPFGSNDSIAPGDCDEPVDYGYSDVRRFSELDNDFDDSF